jgi:predicted RNA-binding Zn-ribbon protein involved in translation (DUF1610 family)
VSGIVFRCPNCGTIQGAAGQCDACHEAAVRYFCMNHTPGVWLDSVACPQCGARFGDPAPAREDLPPVIHPERRQARARKPPRRAADREAGLGPWDSKPVPGLGGGGGRPASSDPLRILLARMAAAARARTKRAEVSSYDEVAPKPRWGGGCVGRVFMLILFLVALFLVTPLFLSALLGLM